MTTGVELVPVTGYKLLTVRRDGTLGPLFINTRQRIPLGKWLQAEDHPTKGYAHRPGWHCFYRPVAPHLRTTGGDRMWFRVEMDGVRRYRRPESQGGAWALADRIKVIA